jgi:putative transposase
MKKGNLYRIYPSKEQKVMLEKHFGCCRFVYNEFLHIRSVLFEKFRASVSRTSLDNHLILLKELHPWLKEVNSQSLQQANKNLDNAYQRFFQGLSGYPQRKTKKDNNSFQVTQRYKIDFSSSKIFIPNVGWIKIKMHRQLFEYFKEGIIEKDAYSELLRTLTVSRTPTRKYHVSILTEDGVDYPSTQPFSHATMIGIDLGITTFASLSTEEKIDNPKFLKSSMQRLKCLQKRVSRKVIGSKNRIKEVKKLAKIHELVVNQRHDFQHKVSLKLISENQAVAVETLNVQGMQKNHKFAQAISDSAWHSFVYKLSYKAINLGKTVLKIGQWESSSKTCHVCGYKNKDLTLKIREWQCPECNTIHDRDINAAINIKKIALMGHEVEPVDSFSLERNMKQEVTML